MRSSVEMPDARRRIDAEPFGEPGDGRLGRTCLAALDLADVLLREPLARELRLRQAGRDTERADAAPRAGATDAEWVTVSCMPLQSSSASAALPEQGMRGYRFE